MSTLTVDRRAEPDGIDDGGDDGRMPRRPRRRLLTPASALVLAAMTCAIGFYVGVRVEKGHIASSPTTVGAGGAFAARSASAAGGTTGGSAAGGLAAGGAAGGSAAGGAAGAPGTTGAAGFAARFGAGNATFGTVASVNGTTVTLTEASGDTVKVKLSSATKISKTETAKRSQIHPGDTITVSGVTGKSGTVSAATVTDSGARSTASSGAAGGSGSAGGSSGGGSSVSSLFSGG